ncbi:hypothetical protein BLNAU_16855 [Blattamonas nauphoetae]|uniref:Secreted protein n=1 Tax=Blattamonas nauphoetae TaxID=2049346 RepID=A0ABQ9XD54_9EUKA|nr:hypothetical protein BLNAU_16855 [Blattamonas nauphoetae]
MRFECILLFALEHLWMLPSRSLSSSRDAHPARFSEKVTATRLVSISGEDGQRGTVRATSSDPTSLVTLALELRLKSWRLPHGVDMWKGWKTGHDRLRSLTGTTPACLTSTLSACSERMEERLMGTTTLFINPTLVDVLVTL